MLRLLFSLTSRFLFIALLRNEEYLASINRDNFRLISVLGSPYQDPNFLEIQRQVKEGALTAVRFRLVAELWRTDIAKHNLPHPCMPCDARCKGCGRPPHLDCRYRDGCTCAVVPRP